MEQRSPVTARWWLAAMLAGPLGLAGGAQAAPFFFSNGNVTDAVGAASRPASAGKLEIEAADDFVAVAPQTLITSATFTGLLTGSAGIPSIGEVAVEIYRVFPQDSNTVRTPQVPTRTNSPSDVAFDDRGLAAGTLSFTTAILNNSFTASNSVLNGINKSPNQATGGEGPVSGLEVQFNVTFIIPFDLPADHYFFVPQVQVTGGEFFWLSSLRPIIAPGTPFAPDLQAWIRNGDLDPDWLRIGTDIVTGTTFNLAFTLNGETVAAVPEPPMLVLFGLGLAGLGFSKRNRVWEQQPT